MESVDESVQKFFGLLKFIRVRHGLSQLDVAERMGVVQATVSRLESGSTNPSFELVVRYAAAVGVDLAALVRVGSLEITADLRPAG